MRALVLLTAVLSCLFPSMLEAQEPQGRPATAADLLVTTEWLAARGADPGITVLHVGMDRTTYDEGHVPRARFVALGDIATSREGSPNELPPAADLDAFFEKLGIGNAGRVIVYGDQKGLFAARVFFTLEYLGHGDRVALLDGGLEKWRSEGRPLSTEAAPAEPRPFTPRINPGAVVTLPVVRDLSWILTHVKASPWVLIDARPQAQFSGAEAGEDVQRPGHIPGASNLFWEQALASGESPVLRPRAELRKLMAAAGAKDGTAVVTYCRTGVMASFGYFVARYLGHPVKMYDGSFVEWSRTADLPVAR